MLNFQECTFALGMHDYQHKKHNLFCELSAELIKLNDFKM